MDTMITKGLFLLVCLVSYSSGGAEFVSFSRRWHKAMGWCNHQGSQLFMGDFNGDGRTDMLCHDTNTGYKWIALANDAGEFTGTSWHKDMGWCNHVGTELHVGDFNGDGRTDMLCHDSAGNKWIALANIAGQFPGNSWYNAMGWCNHEGAELHFGDFNGDGRTDMLCHDTNTGYKWIALANNAGEFAGTSWQKNMGWCNHVGTKLHVGDFNGDGRSDMLCHDSRGRKWIALANSAGQFTGTSWEKAMGWCNHPGAELHLGDYNGDGRTDMLCHDTNNGYKWIALANDAGEFTGTSWQKNMGWCNHVGTKLHVGDFNGDGRTDMLCHDSEGTKWIALANTKCQFPGKSWHKAMRWCNEKGSKLFTGDFNGDGRSDMLCHTLPGYVWVALANSAGRFPGPSWHKNMGWCNQTGNELHVGDFNGDGRTDMLCHDSTGRIWVVLANSAGHFLGTSWNKSMGCYYNPGVQIKVGDFNADGRDDLLCYSEGYIWISLADKDGNFPKKAKQKSIAWCNQGNRSSMFIGDFNNDGRDDLLCHDERGANSVMLAQLEGSFTGSVDWSAKKIWCAEDFYVGDMNGDGRADMVCNERTSGKTDILFAGVKVRSLFAGRTTDGRKRQCSGPLKGLFLADFDGDKKEDMLCHDVSTGHKWIDYSCFEQGKPLIPTKKTKPAKGDWLRLNDQPVCFEGKNEKPGIFDPNPEGFVAAVKLVHRSGKIDCDRRINGSHTSFWGCHDVVPIEDTPLNVFITDDRDNILFPTIGATYTTGVHKSAKWYSVPGFDSRSEYLVLQHGFNAPHYLGPKSRLKIWYGEDLFDHAESDNRGRVCADVYGYFL